MKHATTKLLESDNFLVVEATRRGKGDSGFEFEIAGDVSKFSQYAKALGASVVFLESSNLEDVDFIFDDESPGVALISVGEDAIDLRTYEAKLKTFEKYIGTCELVTLTACFGSHTISCLKYSDWYNEFDELRSKAAERAISSADEAEEREERKHEAHQKNIIKAIRDLRNNDEFKALALKPKTSQTTIIAFVRSTVEGADELPPTVLKTEATLVRDSVLVASQH